ncbi:MAG: hypothetical protein ACYCXN_02610 [Acidimicrobiales bacterium]
MKTKHTGYATTTAALTAVLAAGAMSASTTPASASAQSVVIKAVLPPATGGITAKDNAGLLSLTKAYEKAHTGVTVQWLPNSSSGAVRRRHLGRAPRGPAAEHKALP